MVTSRRLLTPTPGRSRFMIHLDAALRIYRQGLEIAEELVVALDTVKKHVSRVLDKLGVANRTQAVARARELQLLG